MRSGEDYLELVDDILVVQFAFHDLLLGLLSILVFLNHLLRLGLEDHDAVYEIVEKHIIHSSDQLVPNES